MDGQYIISKINLYLHTAAVLLVSWLERILPQTSETWWNDCVLSSLTYTQRCTVERKNFKRLSDLDLAMLLRIANKSWYDMRTVTYLPNQQREVIREMIHVRNNWAHCGVELPGKDTVIGDLQTIQKLFQQMNEEQSAVLEIDELVKNIEISINLSGAIETPPTENISATEPQSNNIIRENSLVYLTADPETKGVVLSIETVNGMIKYNTFLNNSIQSYYSGQIALVENKTGHNWIDIDTLRSYLTAYQINNPSSQNLYSLNSARIDFVPYQFRPALKMIHSDVPRILIADSVGVGKTIEAGLIIKELEVRSELERIVVICPKPLVAERKWELEMKRFDEEFIPLDGKNLRQILSDTDRDGEWPVRYNKVIIPYSILDSQIYNGSDEKRVKIFGLTELDPEPHFDLVIVDEAHHIRNGSMEKEKAFAYKCTKYFCDHADAVIMLTATPLQTSDNDLFTLLNVLRPDVIIDQKTFAMMAKPNPYISSAAHIVRKAEKGWKKLAIQELLKVRKTQWGENVIAENPMFDETLNCLETEEISREERVKIISNIESLHSFNTMLNRTRRRDIQDFCIRRTETISIEFTEYQRMLHDELLTFEKSALSVLHDIRVVSFLMSTIKRQAASCIFGLAPHIRSIVEKRIQQLNDDPECDYSMYSVDSNDINYFSALAKKVLELADHLPLEDPKFEETLKVIQAKQKMPNNKIMLFSTFRHTLSYLKKRLIDAGFRVEQIDGSVKDNERYLLKNRFELSKENSDAIDILLFTEVGSEGLDYQFCDTMINYDLPWNPMRIEQRIGRIDRRGQLSEAVNIYNVITEKTIDAEIYHRCMKRIGIFEKSIGECEEILGEIATEIKSIALNPTLTANEMNEKLEQMADNEIRKIQEINRLEEEEKDLFGFDLKEFTTAQEIRQAENPWLTQKCLQRLIEHYLHERIGKGSFILGEGALKNLRLNVSGREVLRNDLKKLPGNGGRNALKRSWENYLRGKKPNHAITFDSDVASDYRDSFFITSMHPLAKQAAGYFSNMEKSFVKIDYFSSEIPSGNYEFAIYAWKSTGFNSYTKLIPVCENEIIELELPSILETAHNTKEEKNREYDWSNIEKKHVRMWTSARNTHKRDVDSTIAFKLESLGNNHRNRVRSLEQRINDTIDDNIKRMYLSELETVQEVYAQKVKQIEESSEKADVYASLLIEGVISIKEG